MAPDHASDKDLGHNEIETSPPGHAQELDLSTSDFSDKDKARIQWRIDMRLVVPLGLGYTICLIDRGNTGLLAVSGLITDLNLIGYRYQTIILSESGVDASFAAIFPLTAGSVLPDLHPDPACCHGVGT